MDGNRALRVQPKGVHLLTLTYENVVWFNAVAACHVVGMFAGVRWRRFTWFDGEGIARACVSSAVGWGAPD